MTKNFFRQADAYFDRLEDRVRARLSRRPIWYALIGGLAIVLFWRGVWMTADLFPFLTGPVSILISVGILLATGLFVSFFVGDIIILSGIRKEKKLVEKTEAEIQKESRTLEEIKAEMRELADEARREREEHHGADRQQ